MKTDTVKLILAIALALVLGFVCEIIAPETDGRNWISFAIAFVSIASVLIPSMGIKYEDTRRGVSIKLCAWIVTFVIMTTNIIFSCFEYKVDIYIVIVIMLAIIGWGFIYGLFSAKAAE